MTRRTRLLSALGITLLVLAACDSADDLFGNAETQFGDDFARAFIAGENDDPRAGDDLTLGSDGVEGPNYTADPIDF